MNCDSEQTSLGEVMAVLKQLADAAKPLPPLIDRDELAAILRIGSTKLDEMRAKGDVGPVEIKVGRAVLWNREEVMAWVSEPTPKGELMDARSWAAFWREHRRRSR